MYVILTSKKDLNSIPAYREFQQKYIFFVRHCNRKLYQIEFIRCESKCLHCSKLPERNNGFLRVIINLGGTLPSPIPSDIYKDHYRTLEEILLLSTSNIKRREKRIINNSTANELCPYDMCNYTFFSKADRDRHFKLMGHLKTNNLKRKIPVKK